MSEHSLWQYLRDKLLLPDVHATRIENGISAGFPDVHATWRGESITLELKFLRKKNFPLGEEGLNRDQKLWIEQEVGARGRVWIVVDGGHEIFFVSGRRFESVNDWHHEDFYDGASFIVTKGSPPDKSGRINLMRILFAEPF